MSDEPPPPQRWWAQLVDPLCARGSPWHSSRVIPVRSADFIGDSLVSKLQQAARKVVNDKPIAGWSRTLLERIGDYENESRVLVKLADTGRVIQLLENGIKTSLHILDEYTAETRREWQAQLMAEREQRAAVFERLLTRQENLMKEMGEADQQLELLTLMKHGVDKFESVLTPRELDVIAATFNELVQRSGVVAVVMPNWFVASPPDNAQKLYVQDGEEACLRQATILASLNHPNIRKFYGACHVGSAFIVHEKTQPGPPTWHFFLGCALGLTYLHRRGFVFKNLICDTLCITDEGKRGVLSGLEAEKIGNKKTNSVNHAHAKRAHPRIFADMAAFGRTIFAMLAQTRGNVCFDSLVEIPSVKPDFLSPSEWNLLQALWSTDPNDGGWMNDVVEKIRSLDKIEKINTQQDRDIYETSSEILSSLPVVLESGSLVDDIESYFLSSVDMTIAIALSEASEALKKAETLNEADGQYSTYSDSLSVYKRVIDLREQFVAYSRPLPETLVDTYAMIVLRFHQILDNMNDVYVCDSASLHPSVMITNQIYDLQLKLDETICRSSGILRYSEIHCWRSAYISQGTLKSSPTTSVINLNCLENVPRDRATLFIPMEEVQRKDEIDRGAFGSVHGVEWLGSSVVMKQIETNQDKKAYRDQFFQEAELWLKLNHKHLIHLYGVNYAELRPFFICERATGGTLIRFLQEAGESRLHECLTEAALGLEYLHRRGIAHGDLKGNNILVCGDKNIDSAMTKVADFGLSVFVDRAGFSFRPDQLGAIRWKAPECLQGGLPTRESDIFSFGMCIIEAATRRFPWGDIPDPMVRFNVAERQKLPPRPKELNGFMWSLVKRMCEFDADKRIDISTVVNILRNGELDKCDDETKRGKDGSSGSDRGDDVMRKEDYSMRERRDARSTVNRWRRNNRLPNADRTPDRLGDYLVALRNDFVTSNSTCRRGLNLSGELCAYEKETRVLLKLASTGRVVDILLRFGRVVESYMEVLGIEMTDKIRQWREQLELERRERVELFREVLSNEQRLVEAMGDETQQMELLTLLKHDLTHYEKFLTPEELDVISDVYDRVVNYSDFVLVGDPPNWFLSPNDLMCDQGGIYYLDAVRVSKCETRDVLRDRVGDHQGWEDEEEACLRQATVWADLNHPHVAKMLGACHIGNEPFVVHEPAEPLISNRANAQSWEPLLGWALGLQYLHERELGYKSFEDNRLLARHHVTAGGVLSGLGLVPVKRKVSASLQRGVSNMFSMQDLAAAFPQKDDLDHEPEVHAATWSVPNDIFAFGLAIYNTRRWVSMSSDEEVLVLPSDCPLFLNEHEWDLVKRMCASAPERRVSMWYMVHQLRSFVKAAEPKETDKMPPVDLSVNMDTEEDLNESSTEAAYIPPEHIDDLIVPKMNEKVAKVMLRLERKCKDMPGASEDMLQHVVDRLSGVRAQLQTRENVKDATTVMEGFVGVLGLFYDMLARRDLGYENNAVASFCASRAVAQNVAIFHHEIDRLLTLAELRDTSSSAPAHVALADILEDSTDPIDMALDTQDIHDWQIKWNKMRREQLRAFQACLKNTEELKQKLSDSKDRLEAQMLLQFELHKRRSSYPNSVLEAITQALKVLETIGSGAETVPSWFIPPYEVVLGKFVAQDGLGAVYYGKWFDTDVVVKILTPQTPVKFPGKSPSTSTSSSGTSEEDAMELFRREADHWFMLNHQNVVHLYGACHVGKTPFFVCELAKPMSLSLHVESLARARAGYNFEERGSHSPDIMRCLRLAGIGLKYLHERGIVHCDLKGNNFMVGPDSKTIKLEGFGMSVLKRSGRGRHTAHANVGAVPWKAPEYLKGEDPTVMSDIYSFGMCIFELLSGNIPWAGVPEAAVKFHVTKRKALPPRPKTCTDFQWSLIQHMCCYEPSKRMSLDAVVDMLRTFRFES